MKETVLITGGAGFIGSHLCDFFLQKDCKVIAVDNLVTGSLDNLRHLENEESFQFHQADITEEILIRGDIDYILHFASPASPIDYLKIPIETLHAGSIGTDNMLKLAKAKNCRILVASTSEIYGDPLIHPQVEEYYGNVNSVGPRSCYDEAKRFQEALTMAYHTYYGLDIRIARIFNTYGPKMRLNDGRILPQFIGQALRNEPLTVFGDGSQTRSFCYITDLVIGIYKLLVSDYCFPVNLGNPEEISVYDFAYQVMELAGVDNIVFKPLPEGDPKQRRPDITKAMNILEWYPVVSREKGLRLTYDYFKSLPKEKLYEQCKSFH